MLGSNAQLKCSASNFVVVLHGLVAIEPLGHKHPVETAQRFDLALHILLNEHADEVERPLLHLFGQGLLQHPTLKFRL